MCPRASCCLAGVGRDRTTFVSEGRLLSSWVKESSEDLPEVRAVPSGS